MTCSACPNPANCSPTFCHYEDAEVETPHDTAARHFWEPNQALHIEAYTGPSRLHRVLDWVGDTSERVGKWLDRSAVFHKLCFAFGAVLACCFAAGVVVGYAR